MNFSSASQEWVVSNGAFEPQVLITIFLQSVARRLPKDALGHAKLYVEFDRGTAFGSATLVPDELNIRMAGEFSPGDMRIGATLIFGDLEQQILLTALEIAKRDVESELKCNMLDSRGKNHET
jgi:hypothetical protein